jgi:hypothetical protein
MLKIRRGLLTSIVAATLISTIGRVFGQAISDKKLPKSPPVWTGFGLNGSANQGRYELTRAFVRKHRNLELRDGAAFVQEGQYIKNLLQKQKSQLVQFKDKVDFGEDLLVGFAHDYELTVGARLEKDGINANTLYIFMSGVGMIMSFSSITGWRIVSSFPFMLRFETSGGDLKNIKPKAVELMGEAYRGYGNAFVHFLEKFNKWDQGFSSNFFAKLNRSTVHTDALSKLQSFKIDNVFNAELLGFSCSTLVCDNLNIPLLPYQENDALAKRYAVKFSDDLAAQKEISIPDADLKFEVVLRDLDKKIIPSTQRGVTIIRRTLVVRFLVFDEYSDLKDKKLLNVVAGSVMEDRIPLNSTEDDSPERDLIFYDRLLSSTLSNLLQGLINRDSKLLDLVEVKMDFVAPAIPRLIELCNKTR